MSLKKLVMQAMEVASNTYPPPAILEAQFEYKNVKYDQEKGIGNVPFNQNIHYMGFTVVMEPLQFLNLVPKNFDRSSAPDIRAMMKEGVAIASPFLQVDIGDDIARIRDHEGRNRMYAISALHGPHHPVLVQIFSRHKRANNLQLEMLQDFRMRAIPQNKMIEEPGPHFGQRVCFKKEWVSLKRDGELK